MNGSGIILARSYIETDFTLIADRRFERSGGVENRLGIVRIHIQLRSDVISGAQRAERGGG